MKVARRLPVALAVSAVLCGGVRAHAQQNPRSFVWFGEFVSIAPSAVTVRVPLEAHVTRSAAQLQPGAPIVVVWSQLNGEGDVVRYVDRADAMPADLGGYVVRGTFVAADTPGKTLTFATAATAGILQALGTARAGTPVKLTSSTLPTRGTPPAPTAVALNERPKPRPVVQKAATPAAAAATNIAGIWTIQTTLMGNSLKLTCDFGQDSAKLMGKCRAGQPIGEVELSSGSVTGNAVAFQFPVTGVGIPLVFLLKGDVDEAGKEMKGGVSVSGFDAPFTGVKQ